VSRTGGGVAMLQAGWGAGPAKDARYRVLIIEAENNLNSKIERPPLPRATCNRIRLVDFVRLETLTDMNRLNRPLAGAKDLELLTVKCKKYVSALWMMLILRSEGPWRYRRQKGSWALLDSHQ